MLNRRVAFSFIAGWVVFWAMLLIARSDAPKRAPLLDSFPVPIIIGTVTGVVVWALWGLLLRGRVPASPVLPTARIETPQSTVRSEVLTRQTYFLGALFAYVAFGVAYGGLRNVVSATTAGVASIVSLYLYASWAFAVALAATWRRPWGWYALVVSLPMHAVVLVTVLGAVLLLHDASARANRESLLHNARELVQDLRAGTKDTKDLSQRDRLLYALGRGEVSFDDLNEEGLAVLGVDRGVLPEAIRAERIQAVALLGLAVPGHLLVFSYFYRRRSMFGAARRWHALERLAPIVVGPEQHRTDLPLPRFHRMKIAAFFVVMGALMAAAVLYESLFRR